MSSPLSELRTILRILNKWPSTRPRDSIWKTYLREEYRRSAADAASLEALRRRARDYANLLDGVEEQKRLRALDTGAEVSEGVKEAIRRSAARSGLVAPDDVDAPFVDLNKERNGEVLMLFVTFIFTSQASAAVIPRASSFCRKYAIKRSLSGVLSWLCNSSSSVVPQSSS